MDSVTDIFKSVKGAKTLIEALAEHILSGEVARKELSEFYSSCKPVERARCLAALELATRTRPLAAKDYVGILVAAINDNNPSLKREASRIVANTAAEFPIWAGKTIPGLLKNAENDGTVIRWSAALALSEIAKANPPARKKLMTFIAMNSESEENNAIRNIYVKAVKAIEKQEKKNKSAIE